MKILEKYTIEYDAYSWKLTAIVPSNSYLSKTGYTTEERWFPTLRMILVHILDRELKKDCKDIQAMLDEMDRVTKEITELIDDKYNQWRKK